MSGRPNKKWIVTMSSRLGSKEAVSNHMKEIGARGGLVRTPHSGFGSEKTGPDGLTGRERARVAGRKGGFISRRRPRVGV